MSREAGPQPEGEPQLEEEPQSEGEGEVPGKVVCDDWMLQSI